MIFKTSAVRAKGAAGEATRSAGGRGAMRGGGGAAGRGGASKDDEDKAKVEETLEDLHDFRDATGLWASDWVLQVCVARLLWFFGLLSMPEWAYKLHIIPAINTSLDTGFLKPIYPFLQCPGGCWS